MIQNPEINKAKVEMIHWVSELIHEINMIDRFFKRKQDEYKIEFLELKEKYLTY